MNKKILAGSFWLSFGSLFSRVLGIVYLIPWLYMLGSPSHQITAQALSNVAYNPYALFISLGTAGFPSAVARQVAYFNGIEKYNSSKKVGYIGFVIMLFSGVICGVLLYFLAPFIAASSPVKSIHASIIAIRCLVPAIIVLPSMSILRGWFQGNGELKPFGVSQIWEQFARIVTIIVGTYLIIYVLHYSYVYAVYVSVAAAFIGALFSYVYLIRKLAGQRIQSNSTEKAPSAQKLIKIIRNIAYQSIPFIFVGSGITIAQIVDQLFFKQILQNKLGYSANQTQYIFTVFSANPSKITTAIISVAIAVGETSLPLISNKLAMANSIINPNRN